MLVKLSILCYYAKANENRYHYALMVKRSRRRPLTAESRVRFPMGVPFTNNTTRFEWCCFVLSTTIGRLRTYRRWQDKMTEHAKGVIWL